MDRAWLGPGRTLDDAIIRLRGSEILEVVSADDADPAVASGARRVEGFAIPGVHDAHVHVGLSDPATMLAGGVTSARDLGWPLAEVRRLADDLRTGLRAGPGLTFAGPMFTAPGGYPSRASWAPHGTAREVSDPYEAATAVAEVLASGADVIKVALNADAGPTLTDDVLRSIVGAARSAGTHVIAHCQGFGQVARAVAAGVAELAHAPWSERLDDGVIGDLARTATVVSTLDIHGWGDETEELLIACDNLARFARAGGRVLYGTDLGNGDVPAGISVREMRALVRSGIEGDALLVAATRHGLGPGAPGDLVVLDGDPRLDLEAFGRPRLVVRSGRPTA